MSNSPRSIDPARTFEALVQWFQDKLLQGAPGFLVGLSGTDSLVTFLAAAKACEKAGKAQRALGVHFAPSDDFLYDHPEAETHLWFFEEIIPWLRKQTKAEVIVDTTIDWRCDGQRWGYLMDLSVVTYDKRRLMRLPEDQYWVIGTRNRTEDVLLNYSNASMAASLQPIIHLWKSEILEISKHLGVPQEAIAKSCETDCICGRLSLPAHHIPEVDRLLAVRCGELAEANVNSVISQPLTMFIATQISKSRFKKNIPYIPDQLVFEFESGLINLKQFNHRKHLYVAWYYLGRMGFEEAFNRYCTHLKVILEAAGQSHRFNEKITRLYFERLDGACIEYPTASFDELIEKCPKVMQKITA